MIHNYKEKHMDVRMRTEKISTSYNNVTKFQGNSRGKCEVLNIVVVFF